MKATRMFPASLGALLLVCSAVADSTNSTSPLAAEKTKPCFQCGGTGKMKCPVPSCKNGMADCPGPCLKLSKGVWTHTDANGNHTDVLWQMFDSADGRMTLGWSEHHLGEVIQMQNGTPVNVGKCKICGGTTRVKCRVCKGTGEVVCSLCEGKKVVPESWTAFDNPKMKNRPSRFKLKDGTVLLGRVVMSSGDSVTIRTEKGNVTMESANILAEEKQPTQK